MVSNLNFISFSASVNALTIVELTSDNSVREQDHLFNRYIVV